MIKNENMSYPKRECPLCKKKGREILYKLDEFNIVRCDGCGLIFRDIILSAEFAKQLYSGDYFTNEQADYFFNYPKEKEDIFRSRIQMLEPYEPEGRNMLDIGCAIGTFLKIARECGWETRGIETSEYASGYARDNYGLDVICGEFDAEKFSEEDKFDVITMWDVVDHAEDPIKFLKDAASLLKKNGYMFVETTMEDSLVYTICNYIYRLSFGLIKLPVMRGHPVHHSTFFSRQTMRKALEQCGMKIKAVVPTKYPEKFFPGSHFSKMLFKLFYALGNKFDRPLVVTFVVQKNKVIDG